MNPLYKLLTHPLGWIATGMGSGLSPLMPGTVGSLAALPIAWLFLQLPFLNWWLISAVLLGSFFLGCWACDWASGHLGVHDHAGLVWDEFVGQWLVLLVVPTTVEMWVLAFVLFRLFDIIKPWPINWVDKRVAGGFGVMIDDVIAAVYAILLFWLINELLIDGGWTQSEFQPSHQAER